MKDRDELLDELVGALARVRDEEIASSGASKAGKALLEQITSMPYAEPGAAKSSRARRGPAGGRRIRAVTLIAAAVFLVGGVAGAYGVLTQRPPVLESDPKTQVTTTEQLAEFNRFARGIPLPPGGSFDALKESIRASAASMDERGFMGMIAYNAACQWYGYWLAGHDTGDRRQMAHALETIQEIPDWPKLEGGRTARRLARAAAAGDAGPVREHWTINCYSDPNYDPNDH